MGALSEGVVKFVNPGEVSDYEFFKSMKKEWRPHWEPQYIKEPNENVKLRVDPDTGKTLWQMYFENLVERQNIWHKRVMLGEPAPWTDDPVLGQYHFTNVDRRLDRVTLYYIDNVLPEFKEEFNRANGDPKKEFKARAFLLFNTFIYRLFVRPNTWAVMGYIHAENWEEEWARGKDAVREYKRKGNVVWTDAYFVNDLKAAAKDRTNSSDKLENAYDLFQFVLDDLDEMTEFVLDDSNNMEAVVDYLTRVPAVGHFTSYEICLDLGIVEEMTGIPYVAWTPDYYPNVGPGCKKGIDYVFEDRGGLNYVQIIFLTVAVFNHEMQRLGLEYKFQPGATELDLRALEGWYCEQSKYFNYYATERGYDWAKGKRPKKKMKLRTADMEWLKPRS